MFRTSDFELQKTPWKQKTIEGPDTTILTHFNHFLHSFIFGIKTSESINLNLNHIDRKQDTARLKKKKKNPTKMDSRLSNSSTKSRRIWEKTLTIRPHWTHVWPRWAGREHWRAQQVAEWNPAMVAPPLRLVQLSSETDPPRIEPPRPSGCGW